jgi:hypothetical protein
MIIKFMQRWIFESATIHGGAVVNTVLLDTMSDHCVIDSRRFEAK